MAELAWGFQDAVVDVLVTKTIRAARALGARSIVLGGGVAANRVLRGRLAGEAEALGVPLIVPRPGAVHGQRRDDRRRRGPAVRRRRPRRPRPRRAAVAEAGDPVSGAARPRLDAAEVRATLRAAGLRARHSLSQNFLADVDVLDAILAEAAPAPGRGSSRSARASGCSPARCSRRAPRSPRSSSTAGSRRSCASGSPSRSRPGQLRLVEGDALDQDLTHLVPAPYDVVANLPYHITSPILHALLGAPPRPERSVLMVQREVAERIAAPPGKMSYLSVFVQYHARVRIAIRVPPGAFEPSPAVESAVIVVEPYDLDDRLDPGGGGRALAAGPGGLPRAPQDAPQRAGRGSCRWTATRVTEALAATGIDPDRRPQTLAVGEWLALREALGPLGTDRRGRREDP